MDKTDYSNWGCRHSETDCWICSTGKYGQESEKITGSDTEQGNGAGMMWIASVYSADGLGEEVSYGPYRSYENAIKASRILWERETRNVQDNSGYALQDIKANFDEHGTGVIQTVDHNYHNTEDLALWCLTAVQGLHKIKKRQRSRDYE